MKELLTCPRCKRHLRAGDGCPHCDSKRRGPVLAKIATLVAAGGVVSTLAACYGGAPVPAPNTAQPNPSTSPSSSSSPTP